MSAKPSTLPEWNTGGNNRTAPSPTRKVLGWLLGERPAGSYFNHLAYWTYKWIEYLKDGVFSGLVEFVDGAFATANKHFTVSGTGDFKHGDKVMTLTPVVALFQGSTLWDYPNPFAAATAAGSILVPIPLRVGDRLKRVTGRIYGNGTTKITVRIIVYDGSGGAVVSGGGVTDQVPAAAWTTSNSTDPALGHTLAAGQSAIAMVEFDGVGRVQTLNVTYDRP
jgi:hypothetical protein